MSVQAQLVLVAVMSMLTAPTLLVVITVPAILALLELGKYVLQVYNNYVFSSSVNVFKLFEQNPI